MTKKRVAGIFVTISVLAVLIMAYDDWRDHFRAHPYDPWRDIPFQ